MHFRLRNLIIFGCLLFSYIVFMLFYELTNGYTKNIFEGFKILNSQETIISESKIVANEFVVLLKSKQFSEASMYLDTYYDLEKLFTGINSVNYYRFTEQNASALDEVMLAYYVKGAPAEERNVRLTLKKNLDKWRVKSIDITYHFPRKAKKTIFLYLDYLKANMFDKADSLTEDISNKEQIEDFFKRNTKVEWKVVEANVLMWGGKGSRPAKYTIEFQAADNSSAIKIRCTHKMKDPQHFYITKVSLSE